MNGASYRSSDLLRLAGAAFIADPAGALYWPEERLLVIADLHLEKGSAYASRRVFLPPYDTAATLASLANLICLYAPAIVVALGDSFHDSNASQRLGDHDRAMIRTLQTGREWIWIAGNHDPAPPAGLEGEILPRLEIGGIHFRHAPLRNTGAEIAGHLHPVARVVGRAGSVRRRCFVSDGSRCVLPAFGAYTGGLNLRDAAFAPLFGARDVFDRGFGPVFAHVLGRDRVYKVAETRCLPD
jgi:DNA ligase-associated metallophosphoesterase